MWIPPVGKLRNSVCPVAAIGSLSSQVLSTGNISPWGHGPTQAAGTCCCMLTEIHAHTARTPLVPSNLPPMVLNFYTHLAPRPLHLTHRLVWLDPYSVTYSHAHTPSWCWHHRHMDLHPLVPPQRMVLGFTQFGLSSLWHPGICALQLQPSCWYPDPQSFQLLAPQTYRPSNPWFSCLHSYTHMHMCFEKSVLSRKSNRTG